MLILPVLQWPWHYFQGHLDIFNSVGNHVCCHMIFMQLSTIQPNASMLKWHTMDSLWLFWWLLNSSQADLVTLTVIFLGHFQIWSSFWWPLSCCMWQLAVLQPVGGQMSFPTLPSDQGVNWNMSTLSSYFKVKVFSFDNSWLYIWCFDGCTCPCFKCSTHWMLTIVMHATNRNICVKILMAVYKTAVSPVCLTQSHQYHACFFFPNAS